METKDFLNKKCKLVYLTGFVLDGTVVDINDAGITFKTPQKTSFISWNVIRDLSLLGE
jgi:hypothetical protein